MNSRKFHNNTVDINHIWYKSHKDLIKMVAMELDCKDKIEELTEKFLGTQIKIKKFRDPNEPKKPKTGFQFFCDEFRPKIVKKNPEHYAVRDLLFLKYNLLLKWFRQFNSFYLLCRIKIYFIF